MARGIFGPGMEAGVRDACRNAVELESWEVEGLHTVQAWELASEFAEWVQGLVNVGVVEVGRVDSSVCLCVEAFRLRTQNVDLDPVMVTAGLTTLLVPRAAGLVGQQSVTGVAGLVGGGAYALGAEVAFQEPADAKRVATNDRLKEWLPRGGAGMFGKPISEHRRDAMRHLLLRLVKAMGGLVESGGAGADRDRFLMTFRTGSQRAWAQSRRDLRRVG